MEKIRGVLLGVCLFFGVFWLCLAALAYTPAWYEANCQWHGRCVLLGEGQAERIIHELTSFLTHRGSLSDPEWTTKERLHLSEVRGFFDMATVFALGALGLVLWGANSDRLRWAGRTSLFFLGLVLASLPFFKLIWRDLFHPLIFSNRLWLNTPADLSFYLMPRSFFFLTVCVGLGLAFFINLSILFLAGRKGVETSHKGGRMKKLGLVVVGVFVGVLLSQGIQFWQERKAPSGVQAVAEKKGAVKSISAEGPMAKNEKPRERSAPKAQKHFSPDFAKMREALPGNQAIPAEDEDETWVRKEAKKARAELYGLISANKASDEEVESYYEEQALLTRDSIAMLEWILAHHKEEMGKEDLARHTFLHEQFKKRLSVIPERKERALTRIREHRQNKG